MARLEAEVPIVLEKTGTLAEIRTERRLAARAVKKFRALRRIRRLQQQREREARVATRSPDEAKEHPKQVKVRQRKQRQKYSYQQLDCYEDRELRPGENAQPR